MIRQRRNYPEDFKRDAFALVTEQGYSIADASRSLDIGPQHVGAKCDNSPSLWAAAKMHSERVHERLSTLDTR